MTLTSAVSAVIERSSYEGPEVYRAIRAVGQRRLSRAGEHFEELDDPDRALQPDADLSQFFALEVKGAARAGQALKAYFAHLAACEKDPGAEAAFGAALMRDRLDALDAQDARFSSYVPKAPTKESLTFWIPTVYLLLLGAAFELARRVRSRRSGNKR